MRFTPYLGIDKIVSLFNIPVIVDHPVIDNRCRPVVFSNGVACDIVNSEVTIVACSVEFVPIDDNRRIKVAVITDIDIDSVDIDIVNNNGPCPPTPVRIIGLIPSERHPADINA